MIISIPTIKDGYDKDYIISSKLSVFDSEWNITKSLLHNTRTCLDIGAHIGINKFSTFIAVTGTAKIRHDHNIAINAGCWLA